jgi:hypothetical protein
MKTWFLQTGGGRDVFVDSTGGYTLDDFVSNARVEYFEGQLFYCKEVLAKKKSAHI